MKDVNIVVYTMKGCPHCEHFKEMLTKENIEFHDRDIDKFDKEYELFSEITKNDMIPAMLIIEGNDEKYESFMYVPEKDYNELNEAMEIVKNHYSKKII